MNNLKLNVKRTFLIGFAFFGILLLWQVYDSWCPTFLTDIFARRLYGLSSSQLLSSAQNAEILKVQWIVGIIMAGDNLAALILLPIFGKLSDKTNTKIGKRMPYILIGTLISATMFPLIPFFFHRNNVALMIGSMLVVLIFMMMYRNPAVSLMPDITPKPLRSKANGIINIVGYFGGAAATVLGIFYKLSDYINVSDSERNFKIIGIPFAVASVLMVITTLLLFFTIRENKIKTEMKEQMELGEKLSGFDITNDAGTLSTGNRRMLWAILCAEFLWFMGDNALTTYIGNYVIYYLKASSSGTMILIILGGLGSVIGFCIAGSLADKVGRKITVVGGLAITLFAYLLMIFVKPSSVISGLNGELSFPKFLYAIYLLKGFGMALVFNCSYPMVLELCSSDKIGQYTGYYYAASMSAQTITPIVLGFVFTKSLAWNTLPIYSAIAIALSLCIFSIMVQNIKNSKISNSKGLEALGDAD